MNIALIYTDWDPWALGLRSISAILKNAGHQTRLIFMGTDKTYYSQKILEDVKNLVKASNLIGISCLSRGSEKAKQVIRFIRTLKKPIVWGGLHATLNPEECVSLTDMVCVGEGEEIIVELAECIENGNDWRKIANIAYKKNRKFIINPLRPLISNLDELPLMDFSCEEEFHLTNKGFIQLYHASEMPGTHEIVFNGSRGCVFHCTYCCNSKLKEIFSGKGRYIRKMSISKYIECAKTLKQYFPQAKYFYLIDEDFFIRNPDELHQFAKEFPRQVGLPFECCGNPKQISQEKMELLVKAGLWRIRMGIESGSERTKREIYKRPVTNEEIRRAAQIISNFPQVVPYYFLIIANPYENDKDLIETAKFMLNLPGKFYTQAFNLVFFPGSILYERAVQDGLIEGKQESGYELDFRGGFIYKKHSWKQKNLYLNGLIFMMEGRSTKYRLGLLPKAFVPFLIKPTFLKFNNRYSFFIESMILVKMIILSLRSFGAKVLKRIVTDPTSIYNFREFFKVKIKELTKMNRP